jgi:hypothetical protein
MLTSVTKSVSALAIGLIAASAASPGVALASEPIYVALDVAKVARLPPNTATLVIGNPAIADVTMLKTSGSMVITARSYGETNLIALDKTGELVAETSIRVRQSSAYLLIQRGVDRETYSCSPNCMLSPQLGDGKTFEAMNAQMQLRNGSVAGVASSQAATR